MAVRNKKALDAEITSTLLGDIGKIEALMIENWKALITAAVAVVVLIGAVFGVNIYQKSAARKAANVLAGAADEAALTKALQEYPNSPAARYARLRLARIYLNQNKFDEAAAQFRLLEGSGAPAEMLTRMKLDEAYLLERSGKVQEAADRLAAIGRDAAQAAGIRAEANCGAGRLYAQLKALDKAQAALKLAKSFAAGDNGPAAEWGRMADFILVSLESGYYGKAPAVQPAPAK